jgi:ribokinase
VREVTWDVVVVGGANTDYLVRGPRLPTAGETVEGEEFTAGVGGKGANQAVGAARLSARTAFIARVGIDARGDEILEKLAAEGVNTEFVVRDSSAPSGVALIMVDAEGQKQILTAPGSNRSLTTKDIEHAAFAISRAGVLLAQLEAPIDVVLAAATIAKRAGAKVVLDPAPPHGKLPDELLKLIDVIRPNSGEAEVLTGIRVIDRDTARAAAKQLLDRGVGAVAVQAGSEGNLLVWPGGEYLLPLIPVKSIDATGSGDAFCAALAVAMSEGLSLTEAGPFASAAAAHAATKLGAQAGLPRREELLALLAKTTRDWSPLINVDEATV